MIKGKRVYWEDLVEEYPLNKVPPKYASFHKEHLMNGPFTVIAAGKRRIVVRNEDGGRRDHFTGDIGLTPYGPNNWNQSNATFEMIPEPEWTDDWM